MDLEAVALRCSEAQPDAALPCPHCAASVKAKNLARHLADVHAGLRADGMTWKGADHASEVHILVLGAAWVVLASAALVVLPAYEKVILVAFVVALSGALGLGVMSVFGRLPATLSIEGDVLVLRYALGLLSKRVTIPPRSVETGSLLVRRETMPQADNSPAYDVHAGSYLRLAADGASLTLGSKTGTGFRKHWSQGGWSHGAKRRRWDVMLAPSAVVAVEYLLAERGVLKPRGA